METQGFGHFISQADLVARTILVLMALASLSSWYLIVTKWIANVRMRARTAKFLDFFWNAPSLDAVARRLEEQHPDEPFSHLAYHGLIAVKHHTKHGADRLNEAGTQTEFVTRALRRTIDEETSQMESGLTILASIGATAPFVGLLGTVWGIYHALIRIGQSGQASIDAVAGPVGEALIMTAFGLFVAIPAVLAYNFFVRSNRNTYAKFDTFAHDLHDFFATGSRVGDVKR